MNTPARFASLLPAWFLLCFIVAATASAQPAEEEESEDSMHVPAELQQMLEMRMKAQAGASMPTPGGPDSPHASGDAPSLSKEELADLHAEYDGASAVQRAQLKAYYADLGIDLEAALGISAKAAEDQQRASALSAALGQQGQPRTAQGVLSARTKIARAAAYPDAAAGSPEQIANWLRDRVMAGAWSSLGDYFKQMSKLQADAAYTAILRSLARTGGNREDAGVGVLPEEVLDLAAIASCGLTQRSR